MRLNVLWLEHVHTVPHIGLWSVAMETRGLKSERMKGQGVAVIKTLVHHHVVHRRINSSDNKQNLNPNSR